MNVEIICFHTQDEAALTFLDGTESSWTVNDSEPHSTLGYQRRTLPCAFIGCLTSTNEPDDLARVRSHV